MRIFKITAYGYARAFGFGLLWVLESSFRLFCIWAKRWRFNALVFVSFVLVARLLHFFDFLRILKLA